MRIGLPIDTLKQLDSDIAANLKAAPAFLVFDTQSKEVQIIDTSNGVCSAMPKDLDVLIFGDGIGRGMFNNLQAQGVKVLQTSALTVKEALTILESQGMETVKEVECCGNHDDHEHHHHEEGGCCCGGHTH